MSLPTPCSPESVERDPASLTFSISTPVDGLLTPLAPQDEDRLAEFFDELSPRTRHFYSVPDVGRELAHAHCATIGRYDKLRLVLRLSSGGPIIGLIEFSLDLTSADVSRYEAHGAALCPETDCRWGLCVSDHWQSRGVGTALISPSAEVARRCGRSRIILWGGVVADNAAAVAYYRSVGFVEVGRFVNNDGVACIDMTRWVNDNAGA
jgi:GNAT superfamily N-acetyltransferase